MSKETETLYAEGLNKTVLAVYQMSKDTAKDEGLTEDELEMLISENIREVVGELVDRMAILKDMVK